MQHVDLAAGRWYELSLMEQLGNIASEVGRALAWMKKGNPVMSEKARERALELIDLTVSDPNKQDSQRREILRAREVLCDFWWGDNEYKSTTESLEKYFMAFAIAARS